MPRRALAVVAVLVPLAGEARAQWRGAVEVGGAVLEHDDLADAGGALTVGGSLARQGRRTGVTLAGLLAGAPDGRGSAQGRLRVDHTGAWDPGGRARWTLGATGDAWSGGGSERASSAYAVARQSVSLGRGGLWGTVAIGGVRDRGEGFGARVAELGAWRGIGAVALSAGATVVDTRAAYSVIEGTEQRRVTEPATYADPAVALRWAPRTVGGRDLVDLQLRAGARIITRGAAPGTPTRWFGGADLGVPLGRRVELALSVGRQLPDLVHGLPASRWASVGVRLPLARPRPVAPAALPALTLEPGQGGARLALRLPAGARTVEVAGSVTDWAPVALERHGARWILSLPLPSGTHRLLVRVDGGPWTVPAGLPAVRDDEGEAVGVLVVP